MSKFNKGLVFAMEEDGDVAPVETGEQVAEAQVEAEQAVAEVREEADGVEEVTTAIEEAAADAETLEDVQDVLEESVESGEGADPVAAQVAEVAVEAICARLGIRNSKGIIPAMESFGAKSSRVAATRIACEGISGKLKQIWEAIKKACVTLWNKIVGFFKSFFTAVGRMKKWAESLKEKAKDYKGGDGKIDSEALSKMIGGDAASLKDMLAKHIEVTKAGFGYAEVTNKAAAAVLAALGKEDATAVVEAEAINVAKAITPDSKDSGEYGPLVGGVTVSVSVSEGAIKYESKEAADSKAKELAPISTSDVNVVIDSVLALLKETEQYEKNFSKFEAANKAMLKLADGVLAASGDKDAKEGEEKGKFAAAVSSVKKFFTSTNSVGSKIATQVPMLNVRVSKAALTYVDQSMKKAAKPAA